MPRQQPSLLSDIGSALASSLRYPACPDQCRCRIYTLRLPLSFSLTLILLFALGSGAGAALFGLLFTSSPYTSILSLLLATLGVALWVRAVVWDAKWERAHSLDTDSTHTWHERVPSPTIGRGTSSERGAVRVKVPTTLGLLATDVLRAAAQVGAAVFGFFWLSAPMPGSGWAALVGIPGLWCVLLWRHWRQCSILP
ncbi:hypothetical protein A1Q2_06643 [Trichosporon asahii var. asahii CBS 8904]|uniref:Uncharacterized protein n=1 Tax=Trichosporon asahii var. asahii (strain CBS 8904) TaxID=1220162 RepID=K1VQU6_TRIAC|nr:hypothetical protein A1Q2_06643 [Trichosporon asahii var. asahii CBS 8904]